ncbi:MAG: AAA family ATPase [Bacteroidaceae bacterium]|nr:AAA family ATPase [Bacteroidaceae bacterium]
MFYTFASSNHILRMEIQELYINSARLSKSVDVRFKRYMYDLIDWDVRMLCIRGARGVGKTTMMLQYIKLNNLQVSRALYCSLDDLWFTDHHLMDLADYHFTHGGTHLFIDEVHRYPFRTWPQELKNIYDRYPGLHIIFSGSSMLQLDQSSADLSRRCIFYDMPGLSFREYLMLEHQQILPKFSLEQLLTLHETISLDITAETKILPLFTEYLHHGYYPFYRETRQSYAKAIQQVVTNIIDTDLPAVENIEYITAAKMKRLFVILSRMVPFTLNLTDLGRLIEASRQSVLRMCHLLQRSGLVIMLYSNKSGINQLGKPEKLYMENPNILYAMAANAEIGTVRETFFINQLHSAHQLTFNGKGDFLVDDTYTFEVGGKGKTFSQIKDISNSFLAVDDTEIGYSNRIPLWMFGLLY